MIGRTVSHYRVVEKLGGGGMGVVYRARDIRLNRDVALKFLPTELTHDASARERFILEARAASALDHANICTIYDIDETEDGGLFIAMAYYSGRTLKARLAEGPLSLQEAVEIGAGVAAGLGRAHEAGIIHRDIKPANIMITDRREVKILDFGVAKLLSGSDLTRTGSTLGTLAYMSPEQLEGGAIDPATDLWSLGVVLYEALAGQSPFAGEGQRKLAAAILTKAPPPVSALRPEVPEGMDELLSHLLEKDAALRPSSALRVVDQLHGLAQEGGLALGAGLSRRTAGLVALGGVIALILALLVPYQRRARLDRASAQLQQAAALVEEGRFAEAYLLAVDVEGMLGSDSLFRAVMELASDRITIRTVPEGARLSFATFEAGQPVQMPADLARRLESTPVMDLRIPRGDHRILIDADGRQTVERLISSALLRAEGATFGHPWDLIVEETLPPP